MGIEKRQATAQELDSMKGLLREAMESGAAGFSTGLIYSPGSYANDEEILELAKVIEPFGGIYTSHIRNESERLVESVEEVIEIGRRAGVRVDISHHKAAGRSNWGKTKTTLEMIRKANEEEGLIITCDQYPYTRNMTGLTACMSSTHLSQGHEALAEKLKDPAFRAAMRREMEDPTSPYDNFYLNSGGWDGVYVTSSEKLPEATGLSINQYAQKIGKDPWTAYFDFMVENRCLALAVYDSMCEEDLFDVIRSPYSVVGTDGCTQYWDALGHPRASSAFPHAICFFVKEKKILSLEQMIHKMTGLTAQRLCVANKGLLQDGFDADLVIFDYDRLRDTATYTHAHKCPEGIDYVIVNGEVVYRDMAFTGIHSGKAIRYNRSK
jgi:N-acyl-D-amino-acid deacylase